MKLRGNWSSKTTYDVGDVVKYTDGVIYNLLKPCKSGVTPQNTLYWGRASSMRAMCALMVIDMMAEESAHDQAIIDMIPTNINDSAIVLKSSTEESDKEFIITVDDDGELTATEIVPETPEEAAEGGES